MGWSELSKKKKERNWETTSTRDILKVIEYLKWYIIYKTENTNLTLGKYQTTKLSFLSYPNPINIPSQEQQNQYSSGVIMLL